ncbi:CBS domain-containing protein [Pseudonocardia spinosispora]|uniref:CBS domain-containing protein n=1 Tax=Pseudonocardia spinosispora TaxID=103441 RepID=UPI0003FFCF11|nr:CBS domain-containing protein [Pseudonocardia spinosispora]
MTTARDIMVGDVRCIGATESAYDAAVVMADLGVGSLPIRGEDNRLQGMITDRDVVVKVIAAGKDPRAIHTGELAQRHTVTIGVDDDVADLLRAMAVNKVRRLPVMDGDVLVGIVALADVTRALDDPEVGLVVDAISE